MEKVIVTPHSIRGHGNIINPDKEVALSNIYTEDTITSETINGVDYNIHRLNYVNRLIYFTSYPTKSLIGNKYTITGVIKDANGNVIRNGSVKLLVDNVETATASSNTNGEVTFNNIQFSTVGMHEIQLSYNNIKSGKGSVITFQVGDIVASAPSVVEGETIQITGILYDNNNNVISNVPVYCLVGSNTSSTTTDNDGRFSFNYIGQGFVDASVILTAGNYSESLSIMDCVVTMRDGAINYPPTWSMIRHDYTNAWLHWENDGFHILPGSIASGITHPDYYQEWSNYKLGFSTPSENIHIFDDVVVEFVWKGKTGPNQLNFRAYNQVGEYIFILGGNPSTQSYRVHDRNGARTINSSLTVGDRFKLVFSNGNVTIYRNGVQFTTATIDDYDKLVFGFEVHKSIESVYDDFTIRKLSATEPLTLYSSVDEANIGDTITLSGRLYLENADVSNKTITIYDGDYYSVTTTTTDNLGYFCTEVTLTSNMRTSDRWIFHAEYGNYESEDVIID